MKALPLVAIGLLGAAALTARAAGPTVDDVGDVDSFGRNVIYLGLAQTSAISLLDDCTPDPTSPPGPNDRCITLGPQPGVTSFNEAKLASMRIPAKSSQSMLCFSLTPQMSFEFLNLTGVAQPNARFAARPVVVVQNNVLNDPTLIDPNTGAPFNGEFTLTLSTYSESRNLAAGEREQKQLFLSRDCIAGLVSKRSLVENYGLTDTQAKKFFNEPITLVFGASGTAQLVDFAAYFYGIRIYGDAR
jgi:hypothetical protein